MYSASVKNENPKYSGEKTFLGQIFKYQSTYEMLISLPMNANEYTSITCGEFRPSGQSAVKDTSPSVTLYENQVLLKTTVSGFNNYVGAEGICKLSFS